MKNLCIAVYDISDMGGTNQVASSLCHEFIKYYNVTVLSIRKNLDDIHHPFPDNVPIDILMPQGTKNVKDSTIHCFKPALDYFKSHNTDVVLLIGHFPGFILSPVRPFVKTKFIFCDHGALINQWDEKQERLMRKLGTMICHKLVTLTERTRNDYIKLFKMKPSKVECIYNWIDYDKTKEVHYDSNSKKILWAGRFSPEKGNDMMYEVASRVLSTHPDWEWDVYGDGDTLEDYRNKCRGDELDNQLHFKGRTDNLAALYPEYAIYSMTSYREGLPLVLLEAKAAGLPIVSFNVVTGPAEIVRDGIDGCLVAPKNIDAMCQALEFLMDNTDERERLSGNAKGNLDKFSKETISAKWRDLIDNI